VNIAISEHFDKSLFAAVTEATRRLELFRILIRPKKHIPANDIPVVVLMPIVLMMDGCCTPIGRRPCDRFVGVRQSMDRLLLIACS
jgi:hypothetical protein